MNPNDSSVDSRVASLRRCTGRWRDSAATDEMRSPTTRDIGRTRSRQHARAYCVIRNNRQPFSSAMHAIIIVNRAGEWRLAFSPRRHPGTTGERPLPRRSRTRASMVWSAATAGAWPRAHRLRAAPTFSLTWPGVRIPTSAQLTPGSERTKAIARCASVASAGNESCTAAGKPLVRRACISDALATIDTPSSVAA